MHDFMCSRRVKSLLLIVTAAFLLFRFIHLDADYPRNIRWDDGIATDEGWYASSAIDQHTWGRLLLPGDMNISVLMPLWSVVARIAFRVGGYGIVAFRAAAVLIFFGCIALGCALLRRYAAGKWIPLFALLMAVNPWAFAFSRSAFLEFPMVELWLFAAVLIPRDAEEATWELGAYLRLVVAGGCIALAMLLKTTAVVLLPALMYVIAEGTRFRLRRSLLRAGILIGCAAFCYAPFWFLVTRPHAADVSFYLSVVKNTLRFSPLGFVADASRPFRYGLGSDHLLFAFSVLLIPVSIFAARQRRLWRDPLFAFAAIWLVSFLGFMVEHNNDPARYFAVVLPALFMLAIAFLRSFSPDGSRLSYVFLWALAADALLNAAQVSAAMLHPRYSFQNACADVARIVHADPVHSEVVIGDNVPEVSLHNGLKPVNLLFHSASITEQIERYQPGWWLQFAPLEDGRCYREVLSHAFTAEKRGEWTIFYPGQRLVLWKLNRIPGAPLPSPLTPQQTAACGPPVYN